MRRLYTASSISWQLLIAPQSMAQIATLRIQGLKSAMLQTHTNRQVNAPWNWHWVKTIIITYDDGNNETHDNRMVPTIYKSIEKCFREQLPHRTRVKWIILEWKGNKAGIDAATSFFSTRPWDLYIKKSYFDGWQKIIGVE
jgi:hypothetical protein